MSADVHSSRVSALLGDAPNARLDKPFNADALRALVQERITPSFHDGNKR
jgi:hypothetical protein